MSTAPEKWSETRGIRLSHLFLAFAFIGLSGFGGVLPFARHELVERRGWMSPAEFTDILSICQFLPGPNVVNLTVVLGVRVHGIPGAIAAFLGLMAMPVAIVLGLAMLYAEFSDVPQVRDAFRAIAAAAAGLLAAMGYKMVVAMGPAPRPLVLMGAVLVAVIAFRLPLIAVVLVLGPISVALAWWDTNGRT